MIRGQWRAIRLRSCVYFLPERIVAVLRVVVPNYNCYSENLNTAIVVC